MAQTRQDLIKDIKAELENIKNTPLDFTPTVDVPCIVDKELTFEQGKTKGGESISTCVLYVDIRDSVKLNEDKQARTMAKIYTAFTKGVLMAARYEGGLVRNVIGDRIMVVFPEENCYTKAVNCAFTINHVASLINKKFDNLEFRCGIGIDYGLMRVIKVGMPRRDEEKEENRALVWVGYPANYASRLTDVANKKFNETYYYVTADFYQYNLFPIPALLGSRPNGWYRERRKFTEEEFIKYIEPGINPPIKHTFNNLVKFEKVEEKYEYPIILVSKAVYDGFKNANPYDGSIKNNMWVRQSRPIKDIDFPVWGTSLIWNIK